MNNNLIETNWRLKRKRDDKTGTDPILISVCQERESEQRTCLRRGQRKCVRCHKPSRLCWILSIKRQTEEDLPKLGAAIIRLSLIAYLLLFWLILMKVDNRGEGSSCPPIRRNQQHNLFNSEQNTFYTSTLGISERDRESVFTMVDSGECLVNI